MVRYALKSLCGLIMLSMVVAPGTARAADAQFAAFKAAEESLAVAYPRALLQSELKGKKQGLKELDLNAAQIQALEKLMGPNFLNEFKSAKITVLESNPVGLQVSNANVVFTLSLISADSMLVSINGQEGVWKPSGNLETDVKALQTAFGKPTKTGWNFSEHVITSAHANGWLWGIGILAIVGTVAWYLTKQAKKNMDKVGDAAAAGIKQNANSLSGAIDKAGDAIKQVGNSASNAIDNSSDAIKKVSNSASNAIDNSSAAINQRINNSGSGTSITQFTSSVVDQSTRGLTSAKQVITQREGLKTEGSGSAGSTDKARH